MCCFFLLFFFYISISHCDRARCSDPSRHPPRYACDACYRCRLVGFVNTSELQETDVLGCVSLAMNGNADISMTIWDKSITMNTSLRPSLLFKLTLSCLLLCLLLSSFCRFASLRGWWPCLRSSSACAYMYVRIGTGQLLLFCTAAIPLPPHWSQWKPRIRLEETVIAFLEERRWIIMLYYVKDRGGRSRMTATRVTTKTALERTSQC